MARNTGIGRELKKIESEERVIEKEERKLESEEGRIEQKEDLLRVFEELGLMRWKSYYILTAGAILLLSLTFVTAIWVVHDQIADVQNSVNGIGTVVSDVSFKLDVLTSKFDSALTAPTKDWCPTNQTITMDLGTSGVTQITIIGKETKNGTEMCHGAVATTVQGAGAKNMDIWWDQSGNLKMS